MKKTNAERKRVPIFFTIDREGTQMLVVVFFFLLLVFLLYARFENIREYSSF